jgi:hypothetical protein
MSHASDRTGEQGTGFLEYRVPKLGYIFRKAAPPDHGIDGEIEVTDDAGAPIGRLIGVQVKAGADYFKEETPTGYIFRESRRHLDYWQQHSLPVIVVLVDTDADRAYWVEVDSSAVTTGKEWKIEVPKNQLLDASAKAALRDLANKLADEVAARANREYETIRESYLEGRRWAARRELAALVGQTSWRFAPRTLQAEAFRTLGLWTFILEQDTAATERWLLHARTADPASDETIVRAMMEALTNGPEAALPLLDEAQTAGARNMRVLFLAVAGRLADAAAALAAWPSDVPRSAETKRIEAIVAFAQGDLDGARARIADALSEKPRWFAIRETYALIEYAAALPPSERPDVTQPAPLPVPPVLLRHDDESLRHLRAAATTFDDLSKVVDDEDDRRRLELWHVAALANDPERRAEVRTVVAQLLERPLWGPLLAWVLQRNLADASDTLVDRLLAEVDGMDAERAGEDPGLAFLAVQMRFGRDQVSEAAAILDRFEPVFIERNPDALHYWRARIASHSGDTSAASAEAARITNAEMRAEATRDLSEGEWRAVAAERTAAYRKTGDAAALFDAVRLHAAHEEWDVVLTAADELFALLPNLAVLELVCEAAWRTARYRVCLEWIDRWREASSSRSEALDQTRLACLIRLDPVAAVKAADELLKAHPATPNVLRAMTAYLRIGDLKRVSLEARSLLRDPTVDSSALLNATQMVATEDRKLALDLFRKAMDRGVDDDHVGTAISLAHQLGQDHATATLIPRMQKLAAEGRGGIQAMSLAQVLEMATGRQERLADVLAKYHAAEVPIHGVAQTLGWTLAEIFRLWTAENRGHPVSSAHRPLLTRFGGLASPRAERVHERELAMDVTAFLLAGDLELLDTIEKIYAPIRVSRYLPASLFEQQRRLTDAQPSRLAMFGRIVRLVDAGKVRVLDEPGGPAKSATGDLDLDAFVAHAAEDMVFVDQLPITDHELKPIDIPSDLAQRVMSVSNVVEAARRDAVIDDAAHREVVIGLPPAAENSGPVPNRIVLSDLAATTLAGSDALEQLSTSAEIHVLARVVAEARATLDWSVRRAAISSWLDELRERLRTGLENGTYIANGDTDIDVEDARDLDFECLRDILQEEDNARAVWIEDRACSRIVGSVVGIGDVLADLRARNTITGERHAALTHMLRASDFRYLTLDRDDLLVFVAAARNRKLPDTKELVAISRYTARIALDGNRSNGQASTPPEIAVLFETANVTASALPEIWKLHLTESDRAIEQCGWFMNEVYAGRLAVRAAAEPKVSADVARKDTAADLAQLYMGAILVGLRELPDDWDTSTTEQYIHWVSSAFAHRKFFTDPVLIDMTGEKLAALAKHFTTRFNEREELRGLDALIRAVFLLLPSELRHAWLRADPEFGDLHGLRVTGGVQIHGRSLPADEFWTRLEEALSGVAHPEDATVRIQVAEDRLTVSFEGETLHVEDPLFLAFATGGADACASWASSQGELLDMAQDKRISAAKRIGGHATARERVAEGDALRARGARVFYHHLREQLRGGGSIPESGFRLSVEALLDEFRWIPGEGPDGAQLLADVGVEETLRRLITLPLLLPDSVLSAIEAASDRAEIIRRLAAGAVAPLSVIDTATLALRFAGEDASLRDLASKLIDRVFSADYEESAYEAFERAYAATNAWLSFDADSKDLEADDRLLLAMSHASRLIDTIGNAQVQKASDFFAAVASLSREGLARDPEFFDHVLYPTNLSYLRAVVLGLAASLRDVPASVREAAEVPSRVQAVLARLKENQSVGELLKDITLCRRGIQNLFDVEAHDVIKEVSGEAPFEIPTSARLAALLTQLLQHAADKPEEPNFGRALQAVVQQHPLRPDDLAFVQKIVAKLVDENTRAQVGDQDIVMALSSVAGPVAASEDESLRSQFTSVYLAVAREFATAKRDAASLNEIAPAFLEIALAMAARSHQPVASAQELASHIDELIRVWPDLAHALASRISTLIWTAPVDQSVPLWRVVLRAREDAA